MAPAPARVSRSRPVYEEVQPFWMFRLETWLLLASAALVLQLFPAMFWKLLFVIDVRNWTWGVEIAVVLTLCPLPGETDSSSAGTQLDEG